MKQEKEDTGSLLGTAVRAALEAGAAIMDVYGSDDFGVENKADNSPVTIADLRADKIIARILGETGLPVLSEEGLTIPFTQRKEWRLFWIVDPLDGTLEFISRNGEFTVNIALIRGQTPVGGVIYAPAGDVIYAGLAGRGAWMLDNASKLRGGSAVPGIDQGDRHRLEGEKRPETSFPPGAVSLPCASKKGYCIVGSRSFPDERTGAFIRSFNKKYPGTRVIKRGSSLKLCMIATGEADIYPRFSNIREWDTAAGQAIVEASGGGMVHAANFDLPVVYNKPDSLNPWFIAFRRRELPDAVKELIPKHPVRR